MHGRLGRRPTPHTIQAGRSVSQSVRTSQPPGAGVGGSREAVKQVTDGWLEVSAPLLTVSVVV